MKYVKVRIYQPGDGEGLLESTRLNVSEICHRVSYQDVASFSRLFAKTTGMPPAEFRRQIANGA
jgi:YesN/AraC family two-component response regulator